MSQEVIFKLIESIGNPYLLSLVLSICVISVLFKAKIIKYVRSSFNSLAVLNGYVDHRKIEALKHHDVFNSLRRVVNNVKLQKYYTGKEYDAVKTRMCYDFTKQKSVVCGRFMKEFIKRNNIDSMPKDKLKNLIIDLQSDMHKEYINNITELWLAKGIEKEDVNHVVYLFEKFRYEVVASFAHRIESIFGSTFYANNYERIVAIFEMWAMGIDLLPDNMKTTFENLNGKFKDIKY